MPPQKRGLDKEGCICQPDLTIEKVQRVGITDTARGAPVQVYPRLEPLAHDLLRISSAIALAKRTGSTFMKMLQQIRRAEILVYRKAQLIIGKLAHWRPQSE
jgi:hypothetical protein